MLRAFVGFTVTIGLAFLLGWTKNHRHPAALTYSWLFAIAVLLLIRWCL